MQGTLCSSALKMVGGGGRKTIDHWGTLFLYPVSGEGAGAKSFGPAIFPIS